jgi:hypothetical protein
VLEKESIRILCFIFVTRNDRREERAHGFIIVVIRKGNTPPEGNIRIPEVVLDFLRKPCSN